MGTQPGERLRQNFAGPKGGQRINLGFIEIGKRDFFHIPLRFVFGFFFLGKV